MNLKEIRDRISGNAKEKVKLYESGYLDNIQNIFCKDITDLKEIFMHFDIIALLSTSLDKRINKKLRSLEDVIFKKTKMIFQNLIICKDFDKFHNYIKNKEQICIDDELEEEKIVKEEEKTFLWKDYVNLNDEKISSGHQLQERSSNTDIFRRLTSRMDAMAERAYNIGRTLENLSRNEQNNEIRDEEIIFREVRDNVEIRRNPQNILNLLNANNQQTQTNEAGIDNSRLNSTDANRQGRNDDYFVNILNEAFGEDENTNFSLNSNINENNFTDNTGLYEEFNNLQSPVFLNDNLEIESVNENRDSSVAIGNVLNNENLQDNSLIQNQTFMIPENSPLVTFRSHVNDQRFSSINQPNFLINTENINNEILNRNLISPINNSEHEINNSPLNYDYESEGRGRTNENESINYGEILNFRNRNEFYNFILQNYARTDLRERIFRNGINNDDLNTINSAHLNETGINSNNINNNQLSDEQVKLLENFFSLDKFQFNRDNLNNAESVQINNVVPFELQRLYSRFMSYQEMRRLSEQNFELNAGDALNLRDVGDFGRLLSFLSNINYIIENQEDFNCQNEDNLLTQNLIKNNVLQCEEMSLESKDDSNNLKSKNIIENLNSDIQSESDFKISLKNKSIEFDNDKNIFLIFKSIRKIFLQTHNQEILIFFFWILKKFDIIELKNKGEYYQEITSFIIESCKNKKILHYLKSIKIIEDLKFKSELVRLFIVLLDKTTINSICIDKLKLEMYGNASIEHKIIVCNLFFKYIKINQKDALKREIELFNIVCNLISHENQNAVLLLGQLIFNNLNLQKKIASNGILKKLIIIFEEKFWKNEDLSIIILCLASSVQKCEENRKFFCYKNVFARIFNFFKIQIKDKIYDKAFVSCLLFLRGMTRSIKFIRADLVEYPIVELCLLYLNEIRKKKGNRDCKIFEIFENEKSDFSKKRYYFTIIKQTLAVLSNLVLEYGNYKEKFMKKNGLNVIKKLSKKKNMEYYQLFILKNFIYESNFVEKEYFFNEFSIKKNEKKYSHINLETTTNFLENINIDNHEDFTKKIIFYSSNNIYFIDSKDYSHIFNKIFKKFRNIDFTERKHKSIFALKTLREFFNLIRNLVCATYQENLKFINTYPFVLENTILFFFKILKGNSYNEKNQTIKQILYCMVNLTASGPFFKDVFMSEIVIENLKILRHNKNKKINIALIWLIINLTWNNDEKSIERIQKIVKNGFKEWLCEIRGENAVINDKVITALENLEIEE
ncbi:hypothetical protein GVAV_000989 [Gurleya vavrai]